MSGVLAPAGRVDGLPVHGGTAYLGIPYARPPVGPLRFRPPEAVADTPGARIDATRPGAIPPQALRPTPPWAPAARQDRQGEDCLNLDLYVPAGAKAAPVVVHAFGGGFQGGGANGGGIDGPHFAASTGCLLVRPNLRTGALGFLHLAEAFPELDRTNRGMLDLRAVLHWVRRNIAAFGGDPGRVTLTGMSSGAFTATALLPQAAEEGLVHRLWAMSGAASRIVDADTAAGIAERFLHETGVRSLRALETAPLGTILGAQESSLATDLGERNAPGGRTLGIVLDGTSLPRHPLDAIRAGAARDIAAVWSHTAEEARMWYAAGIMGSPDTARLRTTVARFDADPDAVLARLRSEAPDADAQALEETFLTDRIYAGPALATAAAQRQAAGRGYSATFAWHPSSHPEFGASHGFDEPFLFDTTVPLMAGDTTAPTLRATLSGALAALARCGEPGWEGHRVFSGQPGGA